MGKRGLTVLNSGQLFSKKGSSVEINPKMKGSIATKSMVSPEELEKWRREEMEVGERCLKS